MEYTERAAEEKKTDRRVIKTKRAIRNAFAELLSHKDINDITIKDIADTADINRKTVYNYYNGIHEILDEIENDLVSSFEKVIRDIDFKRNIENPYRIFETLTAVINSDMDFYSRLMKIDANSRLVTKIVSSLKVRVRQALVAQSPLDKKKIDLSAGYFTSGMLAAYQDWFNSGREQSIEAFSKEVSVLVFSAAQKGYSMRENRPRIESSPHGKISARGKLLSRLTIPFVRDKINLPNRRRRSKDEYR